MRPLSSGPAEGEPIMGVGVSGLERRRRLLIELHPGTGAGNTLTSDDLLAALDERWRCLPGGAEGPRGRNDTERPTVTVGATANTYASPVDFS